MSASAEVGTAYAALPTTIDAPSHVPHVSRAMIAPAQRGSVVVPGNFDGVHLGHRALIAHARAMAAAPRGGVVAGERPSGGGAPADSASTERSAIQLRVTALTFDPHPLAFLAPERAPTPLCTLERRVELLRGAGCDDVHVAHFDASFAAQSPDQFVRRVLIDGVAARAVVVGDDFRFGAGRAGDLAALRAFGRHHGFEVVCVEAVLTGAERVSSSRVRAAVSSGDVVAAAQLLGRLHDAEGEVVRGDHRGRALGYPTANLRVDPVLLPADGVYATLVRVVGDAGGAPLLHGVANLGVRPTFGAGRSLEVHLLDYDADLYGRRLRVAFAARLRGERKFPTVDALRGQIAEDIVAARRALAAVPAEWTRAM